MLILTCARLPGAGVERLGGHLEERVQRGGPGVLPLLPVPLRGHDIRRTTVARDTGGPVTSRFRGVAGVEGGELRPEQRQLLRLQVSVEGL